MVVVGYGTQKKATLTGSVSPEFSVRWYLLAHPIKKTTAGKTAGVIAKYKDRWAGWGLRQILIRGRDMGATDPLIVVDGVADRSFSKLNPKTSNPFQCWRCVAVIYGARAANGVILWRQCSSGKTQVNYDGYRFSQPTPIPKMLNADDYATYVDEDDAGHGEAQTYSGWST